MAPAAAAWPLALGREAPPGGADPHAGEPDPRAVRSRLGAGAALDGSVRARMERGFGAGLGGVRVHTGEAAAREAARLDSRAFAVGDHVAFAPGEYRPGTPAGDALLAHELAHTLQQRGADGSRPHADGRDAGSLEAEADRGAAGVLRRLWGGVTTPVEQTLLRPGAGLRLQRCRRSENQPAPQQQQPAPVAPPAAPALTLPTDPADLAIVNQALAYDIGARRLFLTGRMAPGETIYQSIQSRIAQQVAVLNALGPPRTLSHRPPLRRFRQRGDRGEGTPQAELVFDKFFRRGRFRDTFDGLEQQYQGEPAGRNRWLALGSAERLRTILRYSAVPGASRHHWGTEVDFDPVEVAPWQPGQPYHALYLWLQANAGRAGFVQAYNPGRTGGHADEPWHWSYAPISIPLRQMWVRDVRQQEDFVQPLMEDWTARARSAGVTLPPDLESALQGLNVREYVDTIQSSLRPEGGPSAPAR